MLCSEETELISIIELCWQAYSVYRQMQEEKIGMQKDCGGKNVFHGVILCPASTLQSLGSHEKLLLENTNTISNERRSVLPISVTIFYPHKKETNKIKNVSATER